FSAALVPVVAVGGGAGLYLLAAVGAVVPSAPTRWAGDVALARALAAEPGLNRLAILHAPASFLAMYNDPTGGYAPLWWGLSAAAMPVGWDFGHPEQYGPLYRRVVMDYDPAAAAELRLTHVAVAPGQVPPADQAAVDAFLARCGASLIGTWRDAPDPAARRLYRIQANACGR
ncbi:MAG: hypothetical protein ACRDI2_09775, partial [Chloroflexota bacterium]